MLERVKKLFQATDMTVGEPWKQIVMFTLPMLIGNIAQQLYSTVDSIVVGKYVGDNALAAVGSAMPVLNMLYVILAIVFAILLIVFIIRSYIFTIYIIYSVV
mgnify:CR=1 FL=1